MVSNHNDVPPAFRARTHSTGHYIGLTDDEVLKTATVAFTAAQRLPIGSRERAAAWGRFDEAMAELAARGLRHVLRKLRERESGLSAKADEDDAQTS